MKTITKTYTKTINKLKITKDDCTSSPREWSNLGYFITCDMNHYSPDKNTTIQDILKETSEYASSQDNHIQLIKKEFIKQLGEKVIAIYPIVKYEHGGVVYSLGTKKGFDYSNNGFYIITDKQQKEYDTPKKDFETIIKQELDVYNKYMNGEVYSYVLYDDEGDVVDSCGGFYDIEDIRDSLPEEWKTETLSDYLTYN